MDEHEELAARRLAVEQAAAERAGSADIGRAVVERVGALERELVDERLRCASLRAELQEERADRKHAERRASELDRQIGDLERGYDMQVQRAEELVDELVDLRAALGRAEALADDLVRLVAEALRVERVGLVDEAAARLAGADRLRSLGDL